jgi:hypothetical protein
MDEQLLRMLGELTTKILRIAGLLQGRRRDLPIFDVAPARAGMTLRNMSLTAPQGASAYRLSRGRGIIPAESQHR